jgi:hypothetical protein
MITPTAYLNRPEMGSIHWDRFCLSVHMPYDTSSVEKKSAS